MKIGRFASNDCGERLGVVTGNPGSETVLDLEAAAKAKQGNLPFRNTMDALIEGGKRSLDDAQGVADWAVSRQDPAWTKAERDTDWLIPVNAPGAMICAGRNFGRHKDESLGYWTKQGTTGIHFEFPCGFIQLPQTLVPHRSTVKRPPDVLEFDYEVEVAAIMAKPTERVDAAKALSHVFGYTVFNDLSAREWQKKEMRNQMIMLGKNFPGFGPLGPWIVTADEIPDPSKLVLDLKVNGSTLQHESCSDMIFGFPELISFWSKAGLAAGDVIASGTPEGVALHRKPDPFEYYLKPGDVVHASVEGIGVLETRIA
jgi:2-keto-4-pentenoate hydratase/2-oxohepta-3-ene-1,7-dioic acid hydratase in catechol pathway